MNADQVRAYVAATWPQALTSPLAVTVQQFVAEDEAQRAIEFAQIQAQASDVEHKQERQAAFEHAESCLQARAGWTVETLGHNIESACDLDADECDDIAAEVLKRVTGPATVAGYV